MRVAVFAVIFVTAAVSFCEAEDEVKTVEQLIKMANEAGAPFTEQALENMDNVKVWGAKRAARALDIVIINTSGKNFYPEVYKCMYGYISPDLLPDDNLDGSTSTVLGMHSNNDSWSDADAKMECRLQYSVPESDTWFSIAVITTIMGDVICADNTSPGIEIKTVVSNFVNNPMQVVVMVSDNDEVPSNAFRLKKDVLVHQIKPKGSRNMFVKASKRGTTVRTI